MDSVNKVIIRVITNQWYYCRRCPPAASSLCSIPGSITRPKQYAQQLSARWPQKKYAFPVKQLNDLAKTRAYPTLAPLLLLKTNAAGYVSIAVLKPCQNKKSQKFVWAALKMVSFSQLPAVKKDTIFSAALTNFRPFLFCDCFNSNNTYALSFCWSKKGFGLGQKNLVWTKSFRTWVKK